MSDRDRLSNLTFASVMASLPPSVPFVAPEALERQYGTPLRLRLGANESAFGISPAAVTAMKGAASQSNWYGDPECHALRHALSERLNVPIQNLLIGNGIDGLLGYVVRTFVDPGAAVVTSLGTYPTFNYHVVASGGALHRVPYSDDRINLEALLDAARSSRARLVYLANPDNPSGTWQRREDIERLISSLPAECALLIDEAYHEFAPESAMAPIDTSDPRVIRVRTFSKAHGMAGARIGYAIADVEIISTIGKFRNQFEVSRVSQAGALASLGDSEFVTSVISAVAAGRYDYERLANDLGLATLPSATNFVCIDVGGAERARSVLTRLLDQGVFIRMPGAPPLDRCIRVTVGTPEQREEFAEVFTKIVTGM